MRVISGSAKGTRLAPVPSGTRPMSDRAREGLFSSLGPIVDRARVLDLYAGTGALGIEALSRGAAHATFVDDSSGAIRTIRENLARTGLADRAEVRRQDAVRFLQAAAKAGQADPMGDPEGPRVTERSGQAFDLVLADPPYVLPPTGLLSLSGDIQRVIRSGGHLVLTRASRDDTDVIPIEFTEIRRLSYGDTLVLISREVGGARKRSVSGDL